MKPAKKRRAAPRPLGRRVFRPAVAEAIINELSEGVPLLVICREERMPNRRTVQRWAAERPDFAARIARAREDGCDVIAEEAFVAATSVALNDDVPRARLAFDASRWLVSKLAAKRYGDRISTEVSGPDGAPIETTAVSPLPPLPVAAAVAKLVRKAQDELGLASKNGRASTAERIKQIVASGEPLHPDLYDALWADRQAKKAKDNG
jgi:hypothetical protein